MTKSEDRMVHDFLYGGHMADGKFRFPDSTLFIGTGFELGGAYEDWGFGVFRWTKEGMQCIASGRSLADAIIKARDRLVCEHEWDDRGWCSKCHGHVKWLGIEDWRSK